MKTGASQPTGPLISLAFVWTGIGLGVFRARDGLTQSTLLQLGFFFVVTWGIAFGAYARQRKELNEGDRTPRLPDVNSEGM